MRFMRKWIFIILPIGCAIVFLAIDYLVSSTEHSYLNTNNQPNKLDEQSSPLADDFSNRVEKDEVHKDKKETIKEKGPIKKNISGFKSVGGPVRGAAVRASYSSKGLGIKGNINKPLVLNLPAQKVALSDNEASFVLGAPPAVFFSLDFVNEQILNHNLQFKNIPVGGLSALSYDRKQGAFVALSDDKNIKGPARFYKFRLVQKKEREKKQYELRLMDQVFLNNKEGQQFASIDPEGAAFLNSEQIFISSEGAQMDDLTEPPAVFLFDLKGRWLSRWALPGMYWPDDLNQLGQWGVKKNKAFEALSVDQGQKALWLTTEHPLHQDEQNTTKENNKQYVRFSRFDIDTEKIKAQFVYPMEADIEVDNLKGKNGVTDFFSLGGQKLIVVERAYLKDETNLSDRKTDANLIRLFLADCSTANNVLQYQSLKKGRFVTCGKRLLANLSAIFGDSIDNIEGITIGPEVSKGTYLLVLVSDNNFNPAQKTQFLFFHYSPEEK